MVRRFLLGFVFVFLFVSVVHAGCVGDTRCGKKDKVNNLEVCDCGNANLSTHSCSAYPSCSDFDCRLIGKCECSSSCYADIVPNPTNPLCGDSAPACDGGGCSSGFYCQPSAYQRKYSSTCADQYFSS